MHHQPIPVAGISSVLAVTMERCYNEHIMDMAAQQKKKEQQERPGPKSTPSSKPISVKGRGHRETLKLHLRKTALGAGWTPVPPKNVSPDVGKPYETPQRQKTTEANQASHSPLMDELLALGEDLMTVLDEYDISEEQELAQAISSILPRTDTTDMEMEEVNVATGFEPEVGHMGYNVNLIWHSDDTTLGSISLVMPQESQMLDEDQTSKAPGTGRPGVEENPGHPITKQK